MSLIIDDSIKTNINGALNDRPMKCPICGYEMMHVHTEAIKDTDTGTRQGGYAVVLEGECGHTWGTIYAEHKGQVVGVPFVCAAVPLED